VSARPVDALLTALGDRSRWVRIGAAKAAAYLAPDTAVELLAARMPSLDANSPVDTSGYAVALARAGASDLALSVASGLLRQEPKQLRILCEMPNANPWAEALAERSRAIGLPGGASRVLLGFYTALHQGWASNRSFPPAETWTDQDRSDYLQRALWNWRQEVGDDSLFGPSPDRLFEPAIQRVADGDIPGAAELLVEVAITNPNPFLRRLACRVLPNFGTDSSPILLVSLGGHAALRPGPDVFNSIAVEANNGRLRMTAERLGAFLAAEALRDFTDFGTARAVASAMLAWQGESKLRAERVLAHMAVDVTFPTLSWFALNLPQQSDRRTAALLIDRIIGGDEKLGRAPLRIGSAVVGPSALNWVSELVGRSPNPSDWSSDPEAAFPILREALLFAGDVGDEGGLLSPKTPPTLDRATDFALSIPKYSGVRRFADMLRNLFSSPDTELSRYPLIKVPSQCDRGQEVILSAQLMAAPGTDTASAIWIPIDREQTSTEVTVSVHSTGFSVAEQFGTLHVPRAGSSDTAVFHLRAVEYGEQIVNVKFLSGTAEVGHCVVWCDVIRNPRAGDAAVTALEPVTDESLYRNGVARAVLLVKTDRDTAALDWTLLEPGAAPRSLGRSSGRFTTHEVEVWSTKQARLIREALEKDRTPQDLDGVLAGLRANGNELFEEIAPVGVADELAKIPNDQVLVIESDAAWIPWEIVAPDPKGLMLGQRFAIVRSPLITKLPKSAATVSASGPITVDRALLVIGDEIYETSRLDVLTFGPSYAGRAKPPLEKASWAQLQREVRGKDVVHFACHGRTEPFYHLSYGPDTGSRLYKNQVADLEIKPGAVVFANACSSGNAEPLVSEFHGFGEKFYLAGARPYIGTLGPVPEANAVEFANLFYTRFVYEGLPAGYALLYARRDAAARQKRPTWLFYCIYGNASAVRRWGAGV
jgi:hypothetical protein